MTSKFSLRTHADLRLFGFASNTTGGGVMILGIYEDEDFKATGVDDPPKMSANLASCQYILWSMGRGRTHRPLGERWLTR